MPDLLPLVSSGIPPSSSASGTEYIRLVLEKIVRHKESDRMEVERCKRCLHRLSTCLAVLLVVQLVLNLGQTSVFARADKYVIGTLSCVASVAALAVGCVSKHVHDKRKTLDRLEARHRRWDKAEDAFVMELSNSLQDGRLTSEEHRKLHGIYAEARDFVDGSLSQDSKKIPRLDKGARHPPEP